MVELPTGRPRLVTTEAPQDRTPGREMAAMAASIGQGLRDVGKGLEDVAVPLAERKGREDANVQLDENGRPVIADSKTSFIIGRAGEAYASAKQTELLVAGRTQVDYDLLDIRQRNEGNPQAYAKEAAEYLNARKGSNVAGIGQQTFDYGLRATQQHYTNMVDQKAGRDFSAIEQRFNLREADLLDRMRQMAAQGGVESEDFKAAAQELDTIREQKVANPRFKYTAEIRSLQDSADRENLQSAAIVGRSRRKYQDTQNLPLVLREAEDELRALNLGEERTQRELARVRQNVAGQAQVSAVAKDELRAEVRGNIDSITSNGAMEPKQFESLRARLTANRMHSEVTQLVNAQYARVGLEAVKYGTPEEAGKALEWIQQQRVKEQETARATSRSLAAYGGVNVRGIVPEVQQRVATLQREAEAAGIPFTVSSGFRDPAHNARVGGARSSQHTHGNAVDIPLPKDPEQARKLVAMIAASGVPGMGYYPNSNSIHIDYRATGAATWGADYSRDSIGVGGDPEIWRTITSRNVTPGPATEGGQMPVVLKGAVEQVQRAYNERAKAAFGDVKQAFEKNFVPTQQEIDDFTALAGRVSDPALAQEMLTFSQSKELEARFGAQTTAQMRAAIQQQRLAGQAGALEKTGREQVAKMEEIEKARRTALQTNPLGLALNEQGIDPELRKVGPLDMQTPGAMAANFSARQRLLNVVGKGEPGMARIALQPDEIPALKAQWDNSSLDERVRMVGEMARSLDGPTLTATLGKVAKNDASATLLAGAGVIMQRNPALGRSLISGQFAIDTGQIKGIKDNLGLRTSLQKLMPATMFPEGTRHWEMYRELAEARYADLSRGKNDMSGDLDDRRLKQAINDVTGGMLSYGKGMIVAPWPGATDYDLRQSLKLLNDRDVQGAFYGNGQRVGAEEIRRTANLQSVGDGKYVPYFGENANSGFVKVRKPDGTETRLVIDLGAKRNAQAPLPPMQNVPVMALE